MCKACGRVVAAVGQDRRCKDCAAAGVIVRPLAEPDDDDSPTDHRRPWWHWNLSRKTSLVDSSKQRGLSRGRSSSGICCVPSGTPSYGDQGDIGAVLEDDLRVLADAGLLGVKDMFDVRRRDGMAASLKVRDNKFRPEPRGARSRYAIR
jgi:hypothetical protein